jgi:hypothetical protein
VTTAEEDKTKAKDPSKVKKQAKVRSPPAVTAGLNTRAVLGQIERRPHEKPSFSAFIFKGYWASKDRTMAFCVATQASSRFSKALLFAAASRHLLSV